MADAASPSPFPYDEPYAPGEQPELRVNGLATPAADRPIVFIPVPSQRARRGGWSAELQSAFIEALADCGCVTAAARSVGKSRRSAYRLLDRPGAASFAAAWDSALATAVERIRGEAFDRALSGAWVPIRRKGKVVREEFRFNDRLALALLSGAGGTKVASRERALSRHFHRVRVQATNVERRAREKRRAAVLAEHQALLDTVAEELANPRPHPSNPRIRSL